MKTKLRLGIHFIASIFLWLFSFVFMVIVTMEGILPAFGITEEAPYYDFMFLIIFSFNMLFCGFMFSWFYGSPLWFIISWIIRLSNGVYEPPANKRKLYTKKNKLKRRFRLYEEVILHTYQLSKNLQKAKQEREMLEKAKKEWIAGVSHDIKTPLTYITGYAALLLNHSYQWDEEEKDKFIKIMLEKGQQIESLVQDFNLLFQMDDADTPIPLKKANFKIIDFLQQMITRLANDHRTASNAIRFQADIDDMEVEIDPKLMQRAIENLIWNAIVHNQPGTRIDVTIKQENQQLVLQIVDNGHGMDQHTIENLFKPYHIGNTNRTFAGTGLGMTIVKNIIEAHEGSIAVTSEWTKGTSITITLPIK